MDTFLPLCALNSQFPHLQNRHKAPCLTLFPWELTEKFNVKYLLLDWYKHNCSFGPWILIIITRIIHIFINQNRNHYNQHIFPLRSKFIYCYSKKSMFGIWWILGKHFLPPADCGSIFPAKSCQDAWRSGSRLARGQVNIVNEVKFVTKFVQLLECWLYDVQLCIFVDNSWALSVD